MLPNADRKQFPQEGRVVDKNQEKTMPWKL